MKHLTFLFLLFFAGHSASAQSTVGEFIANAATANHLEAIVSNFGLSDLLQDATEVTVFVPTDEAVENYAASLGFEIGDFLVSDEAEKMAKYHVILDQTLLYASIADEAEVLTASGTSMTCTNQSGIASANDVSVTTADVTLNNGAVHLIQEVIEPNMSVYDWIDSSSNHNYVKIAIDNAGLAEAMQAITTMTLFAPTDAAFLNFADANGITIYDILFSPDLSSILMTHLIDESLMYGSDLLEFGPATAASGENLFVWVDASETAVVNGAPIVEADVLTHNGLVHSIEGIIQPVSLLSDILQEQGLTILDTLLTEVGLNPSINFDVFQYTLFAPTNAAILDFLAATENTLETILEDPEGLMEGLLYHLTEGITYAEQLTDGMEVLMESGPMDYANISFEGDSVYINESLVIATDFTTLNGVVHIIDQVLEQPESGCMDEMSCNYNEDAVIDDGSCYNIEAILILTDNVCVDGSDGAIAVDSVLYAQTADLDFSLFDEAGAEISANETGLFEDLSSGDYFFGVQDGDECSAAFSVTIAEPDADPLELDVTSTQNEDGTIVGTTTISGGIPPYDVEWLDAATEEVVDATNLENGTYLIVVTDELGCRVSQEITLDYSSSIAPMFTSAFRIYPNPTHGMFRLETAQNGFIQFNVFAINGTKVLEWSGPSTASGAFDLSSFPNGMYTVQVIQKNTVTQRSLLKVQ
jgi:uncharacterized surface protein with fasciclin (FAS1) repeats